MERAKRTRAGAWQLWLPVGVVLLLGLAGIVAQTLNRLAGLHAQQVEQARHAVRLTSEDIAELLDNQRHLLKLFTREHATTLDAVLAAPDSARAQDALGARVRAYFPRSFAYTLADPQGRVLLDDFDGLVGEGCRTNIARFALTGNQQLVLHPNPLKPHYDVMARCGSNIFFVSFESDGIGRILAAHEPAGMQLLLLRRDSSLVEISRNGDRLRPGSLASAAPSRLDASALASQLAAIDVPDTHWRLVALPDPAHTAALRRHILLDATGLLAGLLLFAVGFQWLLARERRQRIEAQAEALEMANLGFVDALTGLPNRRALDDDLAREWLNLERSNEPLSLLMIDLDHFKAFNDTYGHLAGDYCLRTVAQAMRATLRRPRDRIARFGGEEFAILLPNTPCLAAKLLADALHEAVREAFAQADGASVTISIGISCAHAGQLHTAHELLEIADQALYGAKGAGRDTTVTIPAGS